MNWPARKLPEVNIGGIVFYMDTRLEEFREVNDFSNRIPFMKLPCTGQGFQLTFDKTAKNLFKGSLLEERQRKDVITVRLPPFSVMDPEGWKCMIDQNCPAWGSIARSIRENQISHTKDLLHGYKSLLPKKRLSNENGLRL